MAKVKKVFRKNLMKEEVRMSKRLIPLMSLLFLFFVIGCTQMGETKKSVYSERLPKFAQGATYVGSEACADCHEELVDKFKSDIHAKIADFEAKASFERSGCESCHGPASKHIDEEDPAFIVNPAKVDPSETNALCLQCHSDGDLMSWHGSTHDMNGIACVKCHTIHGDMDKFAKRGKLGYRHKFTFDKDLKKPEPELCYQCHKDIMAKTNYPNHHPVKEGKLVCSDCHNPHGSQTQPMLRTDERLNELCFQCHMDKQGPFTFEHAPVVEDCTICHDPHGTVADNLLKQNEPFLCLQCHGIHFHAGLRPDTREVLSKPHVEGKPVKVVPHDDSMQMVIMTRCTQCHPSIHGSDLPSLSVPGGGSRFTK